MLIDNSKYLSKFLMLLGGIIIGVIFIVIFFGTKIEAKSIPNIKINIGNIVKDSHIYIFNKHLHHWFINTIILILIIILEFYYENKILTIVKGYNIILIIHGLLYTDRFDFTY